MILRSSDDWSKHYPYQIYDPDGWDRANFDAAWAERITWQEFYNRAIRSSVCGPNPDYVGPYSDEADSPEDAA